MKRPQAPKAALIVEDHPDTLRPLFYFLREHGFTPTDGAIFNPSHPDAEMDALMKEMLAAPEVAAAAAKEGFQLAPLREITDQDRANAFRDACNKGLVEWVSADGSLRVYATATESAGLEALEKSALGLAFIDREIYTGKGNNVALAILDHKEQDGCHIVLISKSDGVYDLQMDELRASGRKTGKDIDLIIKSGRMERSSKFWIQPKLKDWMQANGVAPAPAAGAEVRP